MAVDIEVDVRVLVDDEAFGPVRARLCGAREQHSVGGEIAEGVRRWWGNLCGDVPTAGWEAAARPGVAIEVELPDGHRARAIIEKMLDERPARYELRGLGVPPFEVDTATRR